jgi:cell filamentation protein
MMGLPESYMGGSGFSKYDRKEIIQSVYCYPDTNVLMNKKGILDNSSALAKYEADMTLIRQYMLEEEKPIRGRFGLAHLKAIHHYIFQDVYPFAGKLRLEDISKGNTFFCKIEYIEQNLNALFARLKGENYLRGLTAEEFAERASFYMSELNMIHPFREGNGRVIREFIRCLALEAGYDIDWSLIDSKALLDATIIAVNADTKPLFNCLLATIIKYE